MLISFSVENWQSFRELAKLSMVSGKERQHESRIAKINKYGMGLLNVAAIYGSNASGKTKFFNALSFAKRFIIRVTQPESIIPREYFKLDKVCAMEPSKFSFELLAEGVCYEFSFAVTEQKVVEEKLVKILPKSEKILYHRKEGEKIQFPDDPILQRDSRLQFVAEGTRDNLLFLTNSIEQKINYFQPIYDWFKHSLILVGPDSRFMGDINFLSSVSVLSKLDTGITRLGEEYSPIENLLPEEVKIKLMEDLPEDAQARIHLSTVGSILIVKKNGLLTAKKLVPYHKNFEGEEIPFDFKDESAGTLRTIDLLPAFSDLLKANNPKVYFIDELDRCLHTLLTRSFLEAYLQSYSPESRSQLIFTTHDVLLMDQNLFRRDEIWITERDQKGCSSIISFGEYKGIRADKDIRKSYLQGRLGGIPKIYPWKI